MKPDSSSVLSSRSRPRQHHSGGLGSSDWPAFSSHPLSALSLHGSHEDYRSEGKTNGAVKPTVCLLLSEPIWIFFYVVWVIKFLLIFNTCPEMSQTNKRLHARVWINLSKHNGVNAQSAISGQTLLWLRLFWKWIALINHYCVRSAVTGVLPFVK